MVWVFLAEAIHEEYFDLLKSNLVLSNHEEKRKEKGRFPANLFTDRE